MKKLIFTLILTCVVFSLGVLADEAITPKSNGFWWGRISNDRRLGYVEGFVDGKLSYMLEHFCEEAKLPALQAMGNCILYRLQQDTALDTGTLVTLDTMTKFYALPQNVPIRWDHALIIARAMVSGVKVNEKDLDVIRQEDAKLTASLPAK